MKTTLIYNTGQKPKSDLISEFVVRLKEFNKIFTDVESSKMDKPEQNYIITGIRGMGKTMLLQRIKYEILDSKHLNKWLIPIAFNEELYNVYDLIDLWIHISEILENNYKEYQNLHNEMRALASTTDERDIFKFLIKELQKNKNKIVLLIDNFDDLLHKLKEDEIKRLRSILITTNEIRVIAATSNVLEETYKFEEPFYEFFKYIRLKELTQKETIILIKRLGENYNDSTRTNQIIEKEKHRINSLRRLSGGNPRTIVLLFEILRGKNSGGTLHYLNEILDRNVTALYKSKMDNLSPQHQRIVSSIAQAWDAVSVKEISITTRLPSKTISAQLNQLVELKIIEKINTSTKNKFYQIKERFFNIWYLMRFSNEANKQRVKWLVRFFDLWCNKDDLKKKLDSIACEILEGKYNDTGTSLWLDVIENSEKCDPDILKNIEIIKELAEKNSVVTQNKINTIVDKIKNGDKHGWSELSSLTSKEPKTALNYITLASRAKSTGKVNEAIKYYLKASELGNSNADHRLGHEYFKLKDFENGRKYFEKVIEETGRFRNCYISELKRSKFYEEAIEQYKLINNERSTLNIAELYFCELDNDILAEKHYLGLTKKTKDEEMLERSYHRLGHIYENQKKFQKAKQNFKKALQFEKHETKACYITCLFESNTEKNEALKLAKLYHKDTKSSSSALLLATIEIWNNNTENGINLTKEFIADYEFIEEEMYWVIEFLILLLSKELNETVLSLFKQNAELKEILKPVYYAVMKIKENEFPDEIKKMGGELKETVDEIIDKINQYKEEK